MQHKSENKYYTVWAKSENDTQGAVSLLVVTFNIWFLFILLFGGFFVSYKWFWNTSKMCDHVRFSWLHDVVKTRSLDVCIDFFSQESCAYVPEKIKKVC